MDWAVEEKLRKEPFTNPFQDMESAQDQLNNCDCHLNAEKAAKSAPSSMSTKVYYHLIQNQNRPAKAFTTERDKMAGKANACSGKIYVSVLRDHFYPSLAENDPERHSGVLVGDVWEDRLECRQWEAHFPHVAGIAGQANYGAQSVALSGGYKDDEDHGEWFLYTGSGRRDRPRPFPIIKELKKASDITERKELPAWDYDEEHGWRWMRPPPPSRKTLNGSNPEDRKSARKALKQAQTLRSL